MSVFQCPQFSYFFPVAPSYFLAKKYPSSPQTKAIPLGYYQFSDFSLLHISNLLMYLKGGFTLQGLQNNITVGILFIDAWFRGENE